MCRIRGCPPHERLTLSKCRSPFIQSYRCHGSHNGLTNRVSSFREAKIASTPVGIDPKSVEWYADIELNGPVGRMIAAVLLGLAEIELEYRQERQAAGIEVAKRKGVYKGRQRGTTKGKPNRAIKLAARGLGVAEIAQALGTSERTVHQYLRTGD